MNLNPPMQTTELEAGMAAGTWWRPLSGFEWREDLKLVPLPSQTFPDDGPWLVARPGDITFYPILLRSQSLLRDAERVGRNPTRGAIRGFADQRGPLGIDQALMPAGGHGVGHNGESLHQWQRELGLVAVLRQLWRLADTRRTGELTPYVQWVPEPSRVSVDFVAVNGRLDPERTRTGELPPSSFRRPRIFTGPDVEGGELRPGQRETMILGAARAYVRDCVNERMRGHISPVVLEGRPRIRFHPDGLLSTIYWQFARELAGDNAAERECANPRCPNGGVFLPGRRDQRSCDANCRKLASYHRRTRSKSVQSPASRERP